MNVRGKKVLVLGVGVSGYAAAGLLARNNAAVKVSEGSDNADIAMRVKILESDDVRCETGGHTAEFCHDADMAVASPGVDVARLRKTGILPQGMTVIGELELGFMFCRAPVIAITGTNGKSTVTELIGKILSVSGRHTVTCGNIGNPLCGEVDGLSEESVAVVEVSSFQLETIKSFKPHIAVLLNISEDHYDRHGNFERYMSEKFRIFVNQDKDDHAVLHTELAKIKLADSIKSRLLFFGEEHNVPAGPDGRTIFSIGNGRSINIKTDEIPLKGKHNIENIACSALVCGIMGAAGPDILEGIRTFKGLSHRLEHAGTFSGVEFIDDSKATNIGATARALESIGGKVVLIAGGRDKGGDYISILPVLKEKVKSMVLIGEARVNIEDAFTDHDIKMVHAGNMEEAVRTAHEMSDGGDTVLLSPMCSSFDMYSSYKERGEAFKKAVKTLMKSTVGAASGGEQRG